MKTLTLNLVGSAYYVTTEVMITMSLLLGSKAVVGKLFCKGPDGKQFRLCGPNGHCGNNSTQVSFATIQLCCYSTICKQMSVIGFE